MEGENCTLSSISRITANDARRNWRNQRETSLNDHFQRAHSEGER